MGKRWWTFRIIALALHAIAGQAAALPTELMRQIGRAGERLALEVDEDAWDHLRKTGSLEVTAFPVGDSRSIDILLERFQPFSPGAQIQMGDEPAVLIDATAIPVIFRGVSGDTIVILVERSGGLEGFVEHSGKRWAIEIDPTRVPASHALVPIAPATRSSAAPHRTRYLDAPASDSPMQALAGSTYSGPLQVEAAFDVSLQLYTAFGSREADVITYVGILVAVHSAPLFNAAGVTLTCVFVHVWTDASMPYNAAATEYDEVLDQFEAYWNENFSLVRRDVAFLLWNDNDGGISVAPSACRPRTAYGLADVNLGSLFFQYGAFGHELGHILNAPHSHCLSPAEDYCANDYGFCSRRCAGGSADNAICTSNVTCPGGICEGAKSCPADALYTGMCTSDDECPLCHLQVLSELPPPGGTLMSICAVRQLTYGATIGAIMHEFATTEQAACLRPTYLATGIVNSDAMATTLATAGNYGSFSSFQIGRNVNGKGSSVPFLKRGYLSVNLNNIIDPTALPVRAVLKIYVESMVNDSGIPPPRLVINRTSAFDEGTLTWANAPLPESQIEVQWTATATGWASINVTTLMQRCWGQDGGVCFWVMSGVNEVDNNNSLISVRSKEYSPSGFSPYLEVEYADN